MRRSILALLGCGGIALLWWGYHAAHPETCERLQRYCHALGQSIGTPDGCEAAAPAGAELPARRELRVVLSEQRVGVLDTLRIIDCPLGALVAERNSQLGRVSAPSARLVHEVRFLELSSQCKTADPVLNQAIARAASTKRDELDRVVFSALWTGREIEAFFAARGEGAWRGHVDGATRALYRLAEVGAAPHTAPQNLEPALAELWEHRDAGALLQEAEAATWGLQHVTNLLHELPPQCARRHQWTPVLERHYGLGIQPELAEMGRALGELSPALQALWAATQSLNDVPRAALEGHAERWLEPDSGIDDRFRMSVVGHAEAWSAWRRACELPPLTGAAD